MKKRIFMLLMTVVMMLGMSLTVFADEVKYYEGVAKYEYRYPGSEFQIEYINVTAVEINNQISGEFTASNGDIVVWSTEIVDDRNDRGSGSIRFNNQYESYNLGGDVQRTPDGNIYIYTKDGFLDEETYDFLFQFYLTVEFSIVENQTPTQISTGFTGSAVSDRGDYNLYIAGYFNKELTDGTHELALSDITSQTIAVIAHNNANGVNRNMNQSTIEEMTITISGGEVTEMIIRGRVQTDGGTLDRYTATINP